MKHYDLIVVGSGASGMMAAITAARQNKTVLLLEKLSGLGAKLKATGGGRCNLTNTLPNDEFMRRFGKNGRFMTTALDQFDQQNLRDFFQEIGVESHAPDGFRVFPITHNASTIITALEKEMQRLGVEVRLKQRAKSLLLDNTQISGIETQNETFSCDALILATGGLGYPMLGAEGDGHDMVSAIGHTITPLYPAMIPLHTKEKWVEKCRADTIAKVELKVDLKKYKKLKAKGDLIFTKNGIRGPVVLDFAREITPILSGLQEVPVLANLTGGRNEEQIREHLKHSAHTNPQNSILRHIESLLPTSVATVLCERSHIDTALTYAKVPGKQRDALIRLLTWTPLTINGHDGFKMAMITRGGISLKEIDPNTMQSRQINRLYFCGEIMDIDGPCGGYNLQWSFASGHLAGKLLG
jgi:predicted Rossmann fold flavoprotein